VSSMELRRIVKAAWNMVNTVRPPGPDTPILPSASASQASVAPVGRVSIAVTASAEGMRYRALPRSTIRISTASSGSSRSGAKQASPLRAAGAGPLAKKAPR
jgi:hypothetical protein